MRCNIGFQAMLSLTNEVDGSKYIYNLNGNATPPGALDTISITCDARTKYTHTLTLPNMSKYPYPISTILHLRR